MSYDGTIRLDTAVDNKGATSDLGKLSTVVAAGAATAVATLGSIGAAALKVGSDFEAGMSQVEAISGTTGKDLEGLNAIAKEMGETTKFTATQSAEALKYMAMAGWDAQSMIAGLPGVMHLAAASGEELGLVSDIVTDAMTAFGLSADESGRFADVLAQASASANTNVGLLGASFKYVAPLAGALGFSVEDTAIALGLMANAGIKGDQAGTALRATLTRLVNPTKQSGAAMEALGIEATNLDGSMKPLGEIIGDIRTAFDGLTESEQAQYAAMLAGQHGMSGFLALVNGSEEDVEKLTAAIYASEGAAKRMADTMNDNLKGKLTLLGSALEGVGIKVYERFQAPFKRAADEAIVSVDRMSKAFDDPKLQGSLDTIANNVADLAVGLLELGTKGIVGLVEHADTLIVVIGAATTGFLAFKAALAIGDVWTKLSAGFATAALQVNLYSLANGTAALSQAALTGTLTVSEIAVAALTGKITLATAAQGLWNAAMAANPIGLVAIAIGALAAGVVAYKLATQDATSEAKEFQADLDRLASDIDELNDSMAASEDRYRENTAAIESEAIMAENLARKVTELADIENKSAGDKLLLKQYVDMLNQSVEGLNLSYDEQAGKLSMTTGEIMKLVEAQKEQLLQQARQERAMELAREQAEAEYNLAQAQIATQEATDKLAEAQANLNYEGRDSAFVTLEQQKAFQDADRAVFEWTGTLEDAIAAESDAQEQLDSSTAKLDVYAEGMVEAKLATEEMAESTSAALEATGEAFETFESITSENIVAFLESLGFIDQALEDQLKTLEDYEDTATNIWGKVAEEQSVSIETMIENLEHNAQAMEQWSQDLETLADRGLNQGLLATLEAAGPEARASVAALVSASDEEIAQLEAAFESGGQAALNALLRSLGEGQMAEPINKAMQDAATAVETDTTVETAAETKGGKIKESYEAGIENADFAASGKKINEGIAQGIENSTKDVVKSGDAVIKSLDDGIVIASNSHSPAQRFIPHGEKIGQGIAKGMENSVSELEGAARAAIDKTYAAAETEVLSSGFQTIGEAICQGMAHGINSGIHWIVSAAQEAARAAYDAAMTELDINSPSRKFAYLGKMTAEGYEQGFDKVMLSGSVTDTLREMLDRARSAVAANHALAGAGGAASVITYDQSSQTTAPVVFERGSIVIETEEATTEDGARRTAKYLGEEIQKRIAWKGGKL